MFGTFSISYIGVFVKCFCKIFAFAFNYYQKIAFLCAEKDRKIEDEHIDKPQFVEQKEHSRKLADTVKAECNTRAKNENEDTFKHT